jgi:hypothetical protein
MRLRSLVVPFFVVAISFTTAHAYANEPDQPAVCIKVFNDNPSQNLVVSVEREPGMDQAGYNTEGPWYIGPNKSTQGIFRANSKPHLHRMKVRVLNQNNHDLRVYEVNCTTSNVGTYKVYGYGTCVAAGDSDVNINAHQEQIHDDGTHMPPNQLNMLILSVHVTMDTRH